MFDFGIIGWAGVSAIFVVISGVGGWVWRLSGRLTTVEIAAASAARENETSELKLEVVKKELESHKQEVAREYVSIRALSSLESRVVDAINKIGDRVDKLFLNLQTQN